MLKGLGHDIRTKEILCADMLIEHVYIGYTSRQRSICDLEYRDERSQAEATANCALTNAEMYCELWGMETHPLAPSHAHWHSSNEVCISSQKRCIP